MADRGWKELAVGSGRKLKAKNGKLKEEAAGSGTAEYRTPNIKCPILKEKRHALARCSEVSFDIRHGVFDIRRFTGEPVNS